MARIEKLEEDIRNNPHRVTLEELTRLLNAYGFTIEPPRGGGDHFSVWHPKLTEFGQSASVPRAKPLARVYVKQCLKLLDALRDLEDSNGKV